MKRPLNPPSNPCVHVLLPKSVRWLHVQTALSLNVHWKCNQLNLNQSGTGIWSWCVGSVLMKTGKCQPLENWSLRRQNITHLWRFPYRSDTPQQTKSSWRLESVAMSLYLEAIYKSLFIYRNLKTRTYVHLLSLKVVARMRISEPDVNVAPGL